jgi:hypothetical protein
MRSDLDEVPIMKICCRFHPGDRVELMTIRGTDRAATVVAADVLAAVVAMDHGRPGSSLSCWAWELEPLLAGTDRDSPAWWPRPCPPAPRGRVRKAWGGRRR